MRDESLSLSASPAGFVAIRGPRQRQALIEACDWLIAYERQSLRDGLLSEDVDRSLDQLGEAGTLKRRLQQGAQVLAVPLGVVPAMIDELAERLQDAARGGDGGRLFVELSELLGQLERLPEAGA